MANQTVTVQGGGDLNGAKLNNAATEATLLKLVSLLDQKNPGSGKKALDLERQAREGNVKSLGTSTKAGDIFSDTLDVLNSETKKVNTSFSRLAGVASGILLTTLSTLGNTFRDFFLGGLDAFRQTSTVGGSFNNSLIELQQVAASTALPLDMFVETIMRNSSTLASFGGTVSEGARRFGQLSEDLRTSDLGSQLLGMGFTVQDLNEGLADYILLQTRLGRTQSQITRNAGQGAAEYLKELDALTRATGISRKSLMEEANRASLDPIIQAMSEGADPAKVAASMGLIAQVGGQELQDALKEIAAGFAIPGENLANLIRTLGIEVEDAMSIFEGQDPERTRQLLLDLGDSIKRANIDKALMGISPSFNKVAAIRLKINELSEQNYAEALEEQRIQEKITQELSNLSNVYQQTINKIKLSLITSGVFDRVKAGLTRVAEIFEKHQDKIARFITTFVDGLDSFIINFIDKIEKDGIGGAIRDALVSIIVEAGRGLLTGIGNLIFGGSTSGSNNRSDPVGYSEEGVELDFGIDPSKSAGLGDFGGFSNIEWGPLATGISSAVVALQGLSLILPKLTKGIPVILSLGAAIGFGGIGLGYALTGVASVIESTADAIDKLPTSLKKFEELTPETLSAVGGGISAIAGPLTLLSLGTVFTLITGDAIGNLGDSLSKFNNINAGNLLNLGPAIDGIAGPITALSLGSVFTLISGTGIGNLGDSLSKFNNINAGNLLALGPAIDGIVGPITALSLGSVFTLISGTGIGNLAESLVNFSEIDPEAITNIAPALESLHGALQHFMSSGGDGGILSSISGAFSNWLKGDSGIGKFAESFQAFNLIDSSNISLLVDNLEKMDSIVNLEYSAKARELREFSEELRTFTNDVRSLVDLQKVESGSTFGNLFGQTKSFEDLVTTLGRVNNFDGANIESFATGIGNIKTIMNDNFATQVEGVRTFANSIDELISKVDPGLFNIINQTVSSLDKLTTSLKKFENLSGDTLTSVGDGIAALINPLDKMSAGGIITLLSSDAIGNLGDSLLKFNQINANNLLALGPAINEIDSAMFSLITGINSLATSLKSFSEVDPEKIMNVAPALESLHSALQLFAGGESSRIIDLISGAFSTWLQGASGIGKFANSFKSFNDIDSNNINTLVNSLEKLESIVDLDYATKATQVKEFSNSIGFLTGNLMRFSDLSAVDNFGSTIGNLFGQSKSFDDLVTTLERVNNFDASNVESFATGIGSIKTVMNDNFATQVEGVNTFANSIDELIAKLKELATSLDSMSSGRRGRTLSQIDNISERFGGSSEDQNSNITSDQIRQLNTLLEQLVSISEETGQTTRDLLGATRGRFSPL
jgi:hypothetical protein